MPLSRRMTVVAGAGALLLASTVLLFSPGADEAFLLRALLGVGRRRAALAGIVLGGYVIGLAFLGYFFPRSGPASLAAGRSFRAVLTLSMGAIRTAVADTFSRPASAPPTSVSIAALVLFNLLSFGTFCAIALGRNEPFLFHSTDGSYVLTLANEQLVWTDLRLGFTNNFLQSLGNVWFPMNAPAIPGFAFASLLNGGGVDSVTPYVIFSLEMFVTVLALARYVGLSWPLSTIAAWSLPLIAYPFFSLPVLHAFTALVPQFGTVVAVTVMMVLAFGEVAVGSIARSFGASIWLTVCALYLAVSQPTAFVLVAPILILFGICQLSSARSRLEVVGKAIGGMAAIGVFVLVGAAHYVLGLLRFTAVYFFPSDFLNDRMTTSFVSVAFQGKAGGALFVLGCLGAAVVAIYGGRRAKGLARGVLACAAVIFGLGLLTVRFDFWRGPSPLYFEFLLWPLYMVFGIKFLGVVLEAGRGLVASNRTGYIVTRLRGTGTATLAATALAPWALIAFSMSSGVGQASRYHPHPPAKGFTIGVLEREIALAPGNEFRGRVATFTGRRLDKPVSWFDLHALDYQLIRKLGNDHRMVGLWHYDIPTLIEYSPLITPPFYLFAKTFFALPDDRQVRSVISIRKPHPSILAAIGVRFVLTDAHMAGATLRAAESLGEMDNLYLYELPSPNVGQYSPTAGRRSTSAAETLSILAGQDFDARTSFVAQLPPQDDLIPASSSRVLVERGGLRVEATSAGKSVILLPLEFSHCLRLDEVHDAKDPPVLFRANLLQTAILFNASLAASIRYFTGPFQNQSCRLKDAEEVRELITSPR